MKNAVPFLGRLFSPARADTTLCKWSLDRQMWLSNKKGLEDQDCCAVTSLLVGTDMERMGNWVLGHNSAAGG